MRIKNRFPEINSLNFTSISALARGTNDKIRGVILLRREIWYSLEFFLTNREFEVCGLKFEVLSP